MEKEIYELGDGYSLMHVSGKEFAKYFAVYKVWNSNFWFRKSFDQACESIYDCTFCYWIKKDNHRIGGVLLKPNYVNCLVLEPPNTQYTTIISKLRQVLLSISDMNKPIIVGAVKPDMINLYKECGFVKNISKKCMIRPTETMDMTLDERFSLIPLSEQCFDQIVEICVDAYKDAQHKHDYTETSIRGDLKYYFDQFGADEILNSSSSLIIEKETNKLVGVCLVSIWEEWPNIFEIFVAPTHQGNRLGRFMLSRAISSLKDNYPVLRLFVTMGNDAENLYNNMGFASGLVTTEMHLSI